MFFTVSLCQYLGNIELTRLISKQNCENVSFRKAAPLNLKYRGHDWKTWPLYFRFKGAAFLKDTFSQFCFDIRRVSSMLPSLSRPSSCVS